MKNKTAFDVLLEIGYSMSDFQDPEENGSISFVFMSKNYEPDVCILIEKEDLENYFGR